jgi:hypothetical protein
MEGGRRRRDIWTVNYLDRSTRRKEECCVYLYVCIQHGILFDRLLAGSGWYPSRSDGSNFRCEQLLLQPLSFKTPHPTPPNRQTPILPARTAIQIEDGLMCWQPGQGPSTFFGGGGGDPLGETRGCGGGVNLPLPFSLSLSFLFIFSGPFHRQDARSNSLDD